MPKKMLVFRGTAKTKRRHQYLGTQEASSYRIKEESQSSKSPNNEPVKAFIKMERQVPKFKDVTNGIEARKNKV